MEFEIEEQKTFLFPPPEHVCCRKFVLQPYEEKFPDFCTPGTTDTYAETR